MRMGVGAVMGAKRLKAVALVGGTLPAAADPKALAGITTLNTSRLEGNDLTRWQKNPPGFAAWVDTITDPGYLSVENFRSGAPPDREAFASRRFLEFYRGEAPCPGCPNDCIKQFEAGGEAGSGGMHQEIAGSLGPNVGLTDLATLVRANRYCNLQGIDPVSAGFSISFAMECFEKGLLSRRDTDGLDVRFGNQEVLLPLLERIATRQSLGRLLGEGTRRAAESLGADAVPLAMQVKSVEMTCFEPRGQTNLALGFATAPIGPRYDICEHDWDFDTRSGWSHTLENSRTLGILRRIPMDYLGPDKVRVGRLQRALPLDLLIFCEPAGAGYRRNASGSPPSTGMTWPVVFALASPASQQIALAQSCGRIGRRVIVRLRVELRQLGPAAPRSARRRRTRCCTSAARRSRDRAGTSTSRRSPSPARCRSPARAGRGRSPARGSGD